VQTSNECQFRSQLRRRFFRAGERACSEFSVRIHSCKIFIRIENNKQQDKNATCRLHEKRARDVIMILLHVGGIDRLFRVNILSCIVDVVSERRICSSSHRATISTARSTFRLSHVRLSIRSFVRSSVRPSGSPGGPYRKF